MGEAVEACLPTGLWESRWKRGSQIPLVPAAGAQAPRGQESPLSRLSIRVSPASPNATLPRSAPSGWQREVIEMVEENQETGLWKRFRTISQ